MIQTQNGNKIPVHWTAIVESTDKVEFLNSGDKVEFDLFINKQGKRAINVRRTEKG